MTKIVVKMKNKIVAMIKILVKMKCGKGEWKDAT